MEAAMCANCGCGIPEDKHGDDRNINWSEIVASAEANDISPQQAVQNIQEMAQQQP
jgi:ribosomal protein S26